MSKPAVRIQHKVYAPHHLEPDVKLVDFVFIIYSILLLLDVIFSFTGNYYRALKYITGTISILLGITIFIILLNVNVISVLLTILFVIWILFWGLFDVLQIKRIGEYDDDYETEV